jgi:aminopeptidase N
MLRWMMYSPQKGDEAFIAMMHDFVKSHHNRNATTESFQAVVERHMTNLMDLKGNRKMDWFFDQWVRGTEIPSYELRYKLTPLEGGKSNLKFTVTQSGVSDEFLMAVPVYVDVQGKTFKLGMVGVKGNSTTSDFGGDMGFTPDRLFLNAHHDILANEIKVTPM